MSLFNFILSSMFLPATMNMSFASFATHSVISSFVGAVSATPSEMSAMYCIVFFASALLLSDALDSRKTEYIVMFCSVICLTLSVPESAERSPSENRYITLSLFSEFLKSFIELFIELYIGVPPQ